ncbi:hypothetical protein F8388_009984 [Cannabis sativa]|uniref:Uncharacterized protein n=1 Tax=Cannabis sativa TaxID=3483 RepID=A0A7J6E5V5_CANSA|nr:hypothetical protein F8388_009984 [Cannabis sativa]
MPAPVHQMQQYYRPKGSLDNYSKKWSAVVDCLTLKTKGSAQVQKIGFSFTDSLSQKLHHSVELMKCVLQGLKPFHRFSGADEVCIMEDSY